MDGDGADGVRFCYSQSRFLKTTYRLVQTTAISTTANGYPRAELTCGFAAFRGFHGDVVLRGRSSPAAPRSGFILPGFSPAVARSR